jgi:hypothetical protein
MRYVMWPALALACTLALAAGVADAQELEFPNGERGFRVRWASLEFEAAGATVRCPVTLEGTFRSRTITSAGIPIADVTGARSAACTGGSLTLLAETLPWRVRYTSFTGVLPNIAGIKLALENANIAGQPTGFPRCTARTTETEPIRLTANVRNLELVSVESEAAAGIRLAGEFLCSFSGSAHVRGLAGPVTTLDGYETVHVVQPPRQQQWVVSLGDSYISGEAGRWAGSTRQLPITAIDRLNPEAYFDNVGNTAEQIPLCHRSKSAEIYIGANGGPAGYNLACSGAKTVTTGTAAGETFKPGVDLYAEPNGRRGQALMLLDFLRSKPPGAVRMVVISVGGNDFNFGTIISNCVWNYINGLGPCNGQAAQTQNFTPEAVATRRTAIKRAIEDVHWAMGQDGYVDGTYKLVVQDYPSPMPIGGSIRYQNPESDRGLSCPFYNADAEWANNTAFATINRTIWEAVNELTFPGTLKLELSPTFVGRRLCEQGVGLLEEVGLTSWMQPGAVDRTEWVNRVFRTNNGEFMQQESLHPNYWGQKALRACLRLVWNNGAPRGGTCSIAGPGKTPLEEPMMRLQ